MSTWAVPALLSATVICAMGGYIWNLTQAKASLRYKDDLSSTADRLSVSWHSPLPAGAFAMLVEDDGKVAQQINAGHIQGLNLIKDDAMAKLYQKMKSRAISGGGFVQFRWVNPFDNKLTRYLAFAKRNGNDTLCVAQPMWRSSADMESNWLKTFKQSA